MADWRSIYIRSYFTKAHHAFLRDEFKLLVVSSLYFNQFGGMKHKGTDMAAAYLRWTLRTTQCQVLDVCLFFIDVLSAYYSVLHMLLDPESYSRDSLGDVIDQLDIPLAFHETLYRMLGNPGAISLHVHEPHLRAMLLDSVRDMWFATRGSGRGCRT